MNRNKKRPIVSAAIDSLETRCLLATLVGTELRIEGTAGNDRIRVETIGANVVVTTNAVAQSFDKTKVKAINANLRAGNDRIEIVWNVVATTTISGEAGNDTVIGGMFKDAIYTGSGNDLVYGRDGGDFIQTATGDDVVAPGFGDDTVDCGTGADKVSYADRTTDIHIIMQMQVTVQIAPTGAFEGYLGVLTALAVGNENDEVDQLQSCDAIEGTPAADHFDYRGQEVPESQFTHSEPVLKGLGGDDTFNILPDYDSYPYAVRAVVFVIAYGGSGNDNFSTAGFVIVDGGDGFDSLWATDVQEGGSPHFVSIESYLPDYP